MEIANLLVGLLLLFLIIPFAAFFVMSEYSIVVSRPTRIAELAERGNAAAKVVQRVMRDPDRFFAATQIGVTITSLMVGSWCEKPISDFFQQLFGSFPGLGAISAGLGGALGLGLASYFQIVLAELIPRAVTRVWAERVALVIVPPMNVLASILRPFIWLLKASLRLVLRLVGIGNADKSQERVHSVAELRMLVEESEKGGALESEQRDMLSAVFSFGDTIVRELITPRTELVSVAVDARLTDVIHIFSTHAYSRVPVYEDDHDHIVGILYVKDLLRTLSPSPNARSLNIRQLMREPFFVPDTQRADELLQQFRTRHESMAVVLDEYGGTAGLVTINDLIEKIVGEVVDAVRGESPSIQMTSDGAVINGLTNLGDVSTEFNLNLSDENYDTLGGYVMGRLGRIPRVGDEVTVTLEGDATHLLLRVEEMDKLRVSKVRMVRKT
jgi:CBS domain containing-hemolysin-like protein